MNWTVRLAEDAYQFVNSLPGKARRQASRSLNQLEADPFRGDVKPLKGEEWKGYYRKRTGDYRIIFSVNHSLRIVDVVAILLRSEKTYR
ncbi:MAG TPA: type II toxin-antitoxin system RelE/ParE family toxin [Bryobacteraceae bacterium]|nr:type II toxin-antitoxin system RelE/ParE family toxin [Bryobacteraceae bacterium]